MCPRLLVSRRRRVQWSYSTIHLRRQRVRPVDHQPLETSRADPVNSFLLPHLQLPALSFILMMDGLIQVGRKGADSSIATVYKSGKAWPWFKTCLPPRFGFWCMCLDGVCQCAFRPSCR
jgi:hypothetical protein